MSLTHALNLGARTSCVTPTMMVSSGATKVTFLSEATSGWCCERAANSMDAMYVCEGSSDYTLFVVQVKDHAGPSVRFVSDLNSEKYRLAHILALLIEEEDGQFVARDPIHEWFGYGDSEERAVSQFLSSIVGDFEGLSERENRLSDALKKELAQLRQLIVTR